MPGPSVVHFPRLETGWEWQEGAGAPTAIMPRLGRGGSHVVRWWYVASRLSPRHFQLQGKGHHAGSAHTTGGPEPRPPSL